MLKNSSLVPLSLAIVALACAPTASRAQYPDSWLQAYITSAFQDPSYYTSNACQTNSFSNSNWMTAMRYSQSLTCTQPGSSAFGMYDVTVGGPIRTYSTVSATNAPYVGIAMQTAGYFDDRLTFNGTAPTSVVFYLTEDATVTGGLGRNYRFSANAFWSYLSGRDGANCGTNNDNYFEYDGPGTYSSTRSVTCSVTGSFLQFNYGDASDAAIEVTNYFEGGGPPLNGSATVDEWNTAQIAGISFFNGAQDVTSTTQFATASGATYLLGAPVVTPEPTTVSMLAMGVVCIGVGRRRRRMRQTA